MDTQKIGVFDSGIGGLTILERLKYAMPEESFIYVADKAYCPYGVKTEKQICQRVQTLTRFLLSKKVKAIVIGCNTASLHVKVARKLTNIPIISVINPSAKQGVSATKNNKIAVLATVATINSGIYQKIIQNYGKQVIPLACSEFVEALETGKSSLQIQQIVYNKLKPIKDEGFDTLIYGCTHFSLLQDTIKGVLGDHITYVSAGQPTLSVLKKVLCRRKLLTENSINGTIEIYTTGDVESFTDSIGWFKVKHNPVAHIDI